MEYFNHVIFFLFKMLVFTLKFPDLLLTSFFPFVFLCRQFPAAGFFFFNDS
jgi:hypothetical protein